jgi:hypothetical protein
MFKERRAKYPLIGRVGDTRDLESTIPKILIVIREFGGISVAAGE